MPRRRKRALSRLKKTPVKTLKRHLKRLKRRTRKVILPVVISTAVTPTLSSKVNGRVTNVKKSWQDFFSSYSNRIHALLTPPRKRGRPRKNPSLSWETPALRKSLGIVIIIIGLGLLLYPFLSSRLSLNLKNLSPENSPFPNQSANISAGPTDLSGPIKIDEALLKSRSQTEPPIRIIVPRLNIDLPVIEAKIVDGYWELSETTASHGRGSANPGEVGNSVIFAHAREGLFLELRGIKTGDLVYVLTPNRWYRYTIAEAKEVNPDQIEVVAPTPDETLTLYTCSGFLDSKRLIAVAKPLYP